MTRSRAARLAAFAAAVVLAHLVAAYAGKAAWLVQLTMAGYYTLVALGLSLVMGFAGQISLGHAGFFAIGGYASAVLTTLDLAAHRASPLVRALRAAGVLVARADLYGGETIAVHPWAALLAAVAGAAAVALVLGVPVLKLKGHYLAMATLGFGTIVQSVVLGTGRLGAADGVSGVPPFPLLPGVAIAGARALRVQNYYAAWALVGLALLLLGNLVGSRVGRALRAIHGAEDAADAMGVDVARYKLGAFVLSAVVAALAGAFLAHYVGGIGPSEAAPMKSVRYVAIVAVGGMGSLWGTLATSAALSFVSLRGWFGTLDDAVFGGVLIAVMLFSPDGILALDARAAGRWLLARLQSLREVA
jgi:branched-chain amino acid transport system permease protein